MARKHKPKNIEEFINIYENARIEKGATVKSAVSHAGWALSSFYYEMRLDSEFEDKIKDIDLRANERLRGKIS